MIQSVLVAILFLSALVYIGRLLVRSFTEKSSCDSGCGKCSAVDFNKIEAQLKQRGL